MHFEALYANLDAITKHCDSVTSRFRVGKSQIEKLENAIALLQANRDKFIPQVLLCGEQGAGKTTFLKYIVNELSPEILTLPSAETTHTNIPTVVTFTPQNTYAADSASHTFTVNYLSREEYFAGLLWVIETMVDDKDGKLATMVRAARSSNSFEDLKKACEAAHDACGNDMPELRKSLRKAADDCREGDRMEAQFRTLSMQKYKKDCTGLAALNITGNGHLSELVKSVSIDVAVSSDKIPCAFRMVDLPAPSADAIHHLHVGHLLSRNSADAMVVCFHVNKIEPSATGMRYFNALLGGDAGLPKSQSVFYLLNRSINSADNALDPQHAEKLLENMIRNQKWAHGGGHAGADRIYMTDGLAGLLHELRAQPDLNQQAKMHFGVENDQEYKNIKRKWNSGRVGNDNTGIKGVLSRMLTYELPKSNFATLKSAVAEISATYCSIVDNIKPDQSKKFEHKFNAISDDALQQFEGHAANIESRVDGLHRALRQNIIETLSRAMDVMGGAKSVQNTLAKRVAEETRSSASDSVARAEEYSHGKPSPDAGQRKQANG